MKKSSPAGKEEHEFPVKTPGKAPEDTLENRLN
jgi:hypothetical protein